jgi:hypothetical protein
MSHSESRPAPARSADKYPRVSPWVGWIAFAGTIMLLLGTFHIFAGLVALFNDDYYLVGPSGLLVNVDFTTWGWVQLVGGVVVILAGLGVFAGQVWARTVGVLIALASALVNLAFLSAYPIWNLIMIGLDIVVILALTVHGSDIKD